VTGAVPEEIQPSRQRSVRLLALDLDGTLIGDDLEISPGVRRAIATAQHLGATVTLATGRMHSFAEPFARNLRIEAPLISYQGGMIRAVDTDEPLHRATMPRELVNEILNWQIERNWETVLYAGDDAYVANARHPQDFFFDNVGEHCSCVDDLHDVLNDHEPMKIIVFVEPGDGSHIEAQLEGRFGRLVEVSRSHARIIEANPLGVSKADALQRLTRHLNISQHQVMAIGDQDNDASMLAWAGVGVAMGNASMASRAAADWVAPPLEKDGVAEAIHRYIISP
jgi:Cof subfamily protein (haloacid dehalogenase superfamily)